MEVKQDEMDNKRQKTTDELVNMTRRVNKIGQASGAGGAEGRTWRQHLNNAYPRGVKSILDTSHTRCAVVSSNLAFLG